jgi:Concanavalin A-like lectin/glucanases superfamily
MSGHVGNQDTTFKKPQNCIWYIDANSKLLSGSFGLVGDGINWNGVVNSNATLTNNPTYNSSFGGNVVFNGINQYIINNTDLSSFFNNSLPVSFFIWMSPSSSGQIVSELGTNSINSAWRDGQIEFKLSGSSSSGSFYLRTWGGYGQSVISPVVPINSWYYIGLTHDGNTLNTYLNGVNIGTTTYIRSAPYNNGYTLYYGLFNLCSTNQIGVTGYSAGKLGSFELYNRALSSGEIVTLYSGSKSRFGL